jgi:two-component system, cell cycle sensor histidine kinase and response regulator CckA
VAADFEQIKAAANRASHLTRRLLMLSRQEQVTAAQHLDINELVNGTANMVRGLLGGDLKLNVKLHPQPIVVHVEPDIIDEILLNLAVNARDAMPRGGRLSVETSRVIFSPADAEAAPNRAPGAYASLRVTDTGTGIARENLARIFEPFFTTKQPGRGTGLGLSMVQSVVKQHRGWVEVDSEIGHGTTFTIYLPTAPSAALPRGTDNAAAPRERASGTILLVEDEADLRTTTRALLQQRGYTVIEAANGAEAVEQWSRHAHEISLIYTDLVLPDGMTGRTLAERAQRERPDIKIIFTTGYSRDVAGRELRLCEGENFVQKPCHPNRMLQILRRSLAT